MERANYNKTNTTQSSQQSAFTCERWMTRRVQTVKPRDSVAHALAILKKHRFNQAPVIDNRKIIGIITDRDLRTQQPFRPCWLGSWSPKGQSHSWSRQ